MARAVDVGQWILDKRGGFIGHVALQKLVYFSQVWSLVWSGQRLVEDDFQAWPMGPVAYDLYRDFKHRPPRSPIVGADPGSVPPEGALTIEAVLAEYGKYSGTGLAILSHDLAWSAARDGLSDDAPSNNVIDLTIAVREYARQEILSSDVPKRPAELPHREFSAAEILSEATKQNARWRVVHERLASA